MVLMLCAPPAAPAHHALLQGNLIAPDLVPSLTTPRAHWRQLPIKGRGLFHAYDVHIRKATLRSCQRFGTLSKGNSLHKTWPPVQPHQEHTGDSSPSKTEPYFMCMICNAGKQRYEVGDEPNFAHRQSPCTRLASQICTGCDIMDFTHYFTDARKYRCPHMTLCVTSQV